jgi:hypothetical protein
MPGENTLCLNCKHRNWGGLFNKHAPTKPALTSDYPA